MRLTTSRTIAFLLLFPGFLPALAQDSTITIRIEEKDSLTLPLLDSAGVRYLPLTDFFSSLHLSAVANDSVRKLEARLGLQRIKFTSRNPFVIVTDVSSNGSSVFQLTAPVVTHNKKYFIPLFAFVPLFNRLLPGGVVYDSLENYLDLGSFSAPPEFDITGLDIEKKLNGYLVTLQCNRKLGDVESWLKPDGWLFVTVANARADTVALTSVKPFGAIRGILIFQSPTSVQLTFRVAPDVEQAEVLSDANSDNLLISLRTRSENEKRALQQKRQELNKRDLEKERNRWKLDVIVIDAGHGGKDPGALGVTKVREKNVTLGVALKLGALIEKNLKGVKVVYTRKNDTFVELYRRTQIANEAGGKLFVSIHCNSMERKPSRANGFEIYLLRPGKTEDAIAIAARENSVIQFEEGYEQRYKKLTEEEFIMVTMAQSAYVKYSEHFAEIAAEAMAKNLKIRNSGVKQAGFYVLVGASMPNVLVETGYISNKKEEKLLASTDGQKRIAEALFRGIKDYKSVYEKALQEGSSTSGSR
ncbi:MAG: N-acetylmuramoyl-L-alanine amidase [Bacteroidota bacterium]